MKINEQTYFVDMPMFAKIDASRPSRSFSLTFRDVRTYTTVCMPHGMIPQERCKEIRVIRLSLEVCSTRVLMGQRDATKLHASRLHKLCPLYSLTPFDILAMGIIRLSTDAGATVT